MILLPADDRSALRVSSTARDALPSTGGLDGDDASACDGGLEHAESPNRFSGHDVPLPVGLSAPLPVVKYYFILKSSQLSMQRMPSSGNLVFRSLNADSTFLSISSFEKKSD